MQDQVFELSVLSPDLISFKPLGTRVLPIGVEAEEAEHEQAEHLNEKCFSFHLCVNLLN